MLLLGIALTARSPSLLPSRMLDTAWYALGLMAARQAHAKPHPAGTVGCCWDCGIPSSTPLVAAPQANSQEKWALEDVCIPSTVISEGQASTGASGPALGSAVVCCHL